MDQRLLEEYAELIVKVGANVKKGQYVIIRTNCSEEKFASLVAKQCYLAGAKKVIMEWKSDALSEVNYNYSSIDDLSEVLSFEEEKEKFTLNKLPCLIWLDGDNPDGLVNVDSKKSATVSQNRYKVLGHYREEYDAKQQWTIAGVASPLWAKKVFPKLSEEKAIEKLWELIFKVARVEIDKSIDNWNIHEEDLKARAKHLIDLHLTKLHYTSKKGTDLTVGLIDNMRFEGGSEITSDSKIVFQPNIPTEECFTTPKKGMAEGRVYATKPLAYNGKVVKDFYFDFKDGHVIDVHAKENEDVLKNIIKLDEGASYLGECALVPVNSPINESNILFFNTLYDENASCHLAIGKGFPTLYPGYEKLSMDQLQEIGINHSMSHVDFMIGDETLNIVGTTKDNKEVQIFKNGRWAF